MSSADLNVMSIESEDEMDLQLFEELMSEFLGGHLINSSGGRLRVFGSAGRGGPASRTKAHPRLPALGVPSNGQEQETLTRLLADNPVLQRLAEIEDMLIAHQLSGAVEVHGNGLQRLCRYAKDDKWEMGILQSGSKIIQSIFRQRIATDEDKTYEGRLIKEYKPIHHRQNGNDLSQFDLEVTTAIGDRSQKNVQFSWIKTPAAPFHKGFIDSVAQSGIQGNGWGCSRLFNMVVDNPPTYYHRGIDWLEIFHVYKADSTSNGRTRERPFIDILENLMCLFCK
ncbi:hypothetical protein FOL47_009116 [Perkinsus chesapeaki]|uniref:Uncharacterized protein n=1 Tax=Perkinsus chesapeaki TaxID=330153 RepID=A0A7J6LAE5_PERCH|nr:hypothetical protein FOL47_009116 [Perkinsus chesapeaki]